MILSGMVLGMSVLCISHCLTQTKIEARHYLMAAITVLLSWLSLGSVMMLSNGWLAKLYISMIPTVFFLLPVLLSWFQKCLVVDEKFAIQGQERLKLIPVIPAGLLSILFLLMPSTDFNAMFFGDPVESIWIVILSLYFALMFVVWIIMSSFYTYRMTKYGRKYHQELMLHYSNLAGRKISWFSLLLSFLIFTWIYSLATLMLEEVMNTILISSSIVSVLVMCLVWFFCLFAMRHKPVLLKNEQESQPEKIEQYANSAISEDRLQRIAGKIEQYMQKEKAYLDCDLTAEKLASEISVPQHYLSQTFSQHLNSTFYQYVNQCRIAEAKQRLKHSEETVLDIALSVGYNSRSAFYTAFKRETQMTPTQFRKE